MDLLPLDSKTLVAEVKTQYPAGLIGVAGAPVYLSWQVKSDLIGAVQQAFHIQVSNAKDFESLTWDSGRVSGSNQLGFEVPGSPFASREQRYYRVRIETNAGVTEWSEPVFVEAGLLDSSDWNAKFIGDVGSKEGPSPILRREIDLAKTPVKARLYATAMGLYEFYVNGVNVSDSYLNPGWTSYQERLLVETHDVSHLLASGVNVLSATLSDGWWRGRFGFMNRSEHYGKEIGLLAQLEITYADGSAEVFASDSNWKVSTGEIRFSSIYDGSTVDFNLEQSGWQQPGFDSSKWESASVKDFDFKTLYPRITNPVRKVKEFNMQIERQADRYLLRGPQNISGWIKLTVDGKKGQSVTVRHAEVLEPGDKLHTKALRSAKCTDVYILAEDGVQDLEPKFTFHGFQYGDVVTDAELIAASQVAISSDNARRGHLETSNAKLNRLHENVVWSQLDNFVSVPTDCPQRDERLGWTGDAQAFAATANTLFDSSSFWKSWLIDLEIDQHDNGDVGAVVPDLLKLYGDVPIPGWILEGRAGWADAATVVPMAVYEYFGDKEVLVKQLSSMRRWVNALDARRQGEKFLPSEFQFGDWCDPDAPGSRPWDSKVSADFVANAFFKHTADLMVAVEELVGTTELANHYRAISNQLKADIWSQFGAEAQTTTSGCAMSIEFDIVPDAQKQDLADTLANMVVADNGKITTGFLGTPLILHALSKNGHVDVAYVMLMRTEFRSWLYAVDKGATTIWERWDAIREDGSIHSGDMDTNPDGQDDSSMISFNHYAYGAVVDWMYRNVGGLAPVLEKPGYQQVLVAPRPAEGISSSSVSIATGLGEISLQWRTESDGVLSADLKIPFGTSGVLDFPVTPESMIICDGVEISNGEVLEHGTYNIFVTKAHVSASKSASAKS